MQKNSIINNVATSSSVLFGNAENIEKENKSGMLLSFSNMKRRLVHKIITSKNGTPDDYYNTRKQSFLAYETTVIQLKVQIDSILEGKSDLP